MEFITLYSRIRKAIHWLQTKKPNKPIDPIAYIIPTSPNTGFLLYVDTICDIIPNPGIIII